MTKTTARTFIAAIALLIASVMISLYGHRMAESRMSALEGRSEVIMYDGDDMSFDSWENATTLTAMLAMSMLLAGTILWDRETPPQMGGSSILGLNAGEAKQIVRATAPQRSTLTTDVHVDGSSTQPHEEDCLTPLERVSGVIKLRA